MVPLSSLRIPRARRYSGYCLLTFAFTYMILTFSDRPSHAVRLASVIESAVLTPGVLLLPVWPLPLSLAATHRISFDFSSSAYLDVSVRRVPHVYLCIQYTFSVSSTEGFPHSEIHGYIAYLQLPVAYRSLSRPSSAPDAKASALCSY